MDAIDAVVTQKRITQKNDAEEPKHKKKQEKSFTIVPIRCTDKKKQHVNLLYIQDAQDHNVGHFMWIKNLSRLVSSQLSKNKCKKYICDRKLNDCAIILPNYDNKWLSFINYCRKEQIPFVVYADLECILEKTPREEQTSSYAY
ncbi:uncharacterized protein LOC105190293 [Harpegnathos saltator]|uniref:uncharacterized protein LOC105190293 n=1 Tax=Harpegnathos saltator TaxID=610380 RepID=UPI000DBEE5DD|nr:uncharacterized protein LOC105190293 [Harpegnathos saltator]